MKAVRNGSSPNLSLIPVTGSEPCVSTDMFFLESYGGAEAKLATRLCRRCPVVEACFIWALANPSLTADGVWGATTPRQRDDMRAELIERLGSSRFQQVLKEAYARAARKCGLVQDLRRQGDGRGK